MKRIILEIKEHKVDFVMDLLRNMPFVNITELPEDQKIKKATPEE